jgi:hypothetical protein
MLCFTANFAGEKSYLFLTKNENFIGHDYHDANCEVVRTHVTVSMQSCFQKLCDIV